MPENYAVDFESNIDLHKNQIKNVVIDTVTSDPSGSEGQIIYNSTSKTLKYFTNSAWVTLAQGGSLDQYQLKSEKGAANGYAGLGSDSKVIIGQLPTGNGANSIPLIVSTIGDGAVLQYSNSAQGFVARTIGTVYTYKGSVTNSSALPVSGQQTGDTYNIEQAGGGYNAGDNVAWNGSAWDNLAGTVDTSGFQTKANLVTTLSGASDSTYPSTKAVSDALAGKQDAISLTANRAVVTGTGGTLEASTVTSTEIGYLAGADSNIQDQIEGKQDVITGAATTILTSQLDENLALVSNASGKVATSAVTATELGYLDGVTSSIQDQIDGVKATADAAVPGLLTGPNAGDYTKVTVNSDGLVTAGTSLSASDIPDISATYIKTERIGAASGVASLGSDTKIPYDELPTGNAENKVPLLSAAGTAGQVLALNGSANAFVFVTPVERSSGEIQGNGSTTSFPISHGLSGMPTSVVIVDDTTKAVVHTNIVYTNASTITVNFNTAPAASKKYTVYMSG